MYLSVYCIIKCCYCCFCKSKERKMLLSAISFLVLYVSVCSRAHIYLLSSRSHMRYSFILFRLFAGWLTGSELNVNDENTTYQYTIRWMGITHILYCSRCFLQIMHLLNSLYWCHFCCCCCFMLSFIWPFGCFVVARVYVFPFVMRLVVLFVIACKLTIHT